MTNDSKKEFQRIAKFIASSGLSSRRQAEKLISEGRVQIDGEVISSPAINTVSYTHLTLPTTLQV